MYVKRLKLANFKSFKGENNVFEFSPHINYFVGNNNAGKSTVIEALEFMSSPHTDAESLKNTQCGDQPCYAELTLAGNDIEAQIDKSNVTEAKAKTIKKSCILTEQNEQCLIARRYLNNPKTVFLFCKDAEIGKSPFNNKTGIDKPFTAIFSPTVFHATDTPDDVLDFGTTKILGKLIRAKTHNLTTSNEWKEFEKSYELVFSSTGKYSEILKDLNESLSEHTREQFPSVTVSFAFDQPDASSFIKMGKTRVDDGVETDLDQKGTGLQRAVAFAALREYAHILSSDARDDSESGIDNLFLCVDEPEIWMHPKAQKQLAKTLATISETNQVWISTHSPYILQGAFATNQKEKDSVNLLVFSDNHDAPHRVQKSTRFGKLHKGAPSLAEITYEAFQIPTIEYCLELFGVIYTYMEKLNFTDKGKTFKYKSLLDLTDDILKSQSFGLPEAYKESKKRFDSRKGRKKDNSWKNPIVDEILPLCIRNMNDHPESISKQQDAINYFQNNNNKDNGGNPLSPEELKEIEKISNQYNDEDLRKAIEISLKAIPRCEELMQQGHWTWDSGVNDLVDNVVSTNASTHETD